MSAVLEREVVPLGARYRLIAPTRTYRDQVLRFLAGIDAAPPRDALAPRLLALRAAARGRVAVAFEDGGLLQWLDAWHNAILPSGYHAAAELRPVPRARGLFAALGREADRFSGRAVAELSLLEARLVGFVKAMLLEADLLVLDGLFERLGAEEEREVARWIALHRARYPLRRVLYLGLQDPGARLDGFAALEAP